MTKPANFPGRKLRRQIRAQQGQYAEHDPVNAQAIEQAKQIKTKKNRSGHVRQR